MSQEKKAEGKGSSEEAIIEGRRAKADAIRARGAIPYANVVAPKGTARSLDIDAARALADAAKGEGGRFDAEAVERACGGERVHVKGRVVALRSTGGLSFLRLRDRTGEIQLLLEEATCTTYADLATLDVGDFVQAEGPLMATKRGELSVKTESFALLTKSVRPLPEKWHGLQDVELRYRQRYVDLVANPEVGQVFKARSLIVRAVRSYLDGAGFLEVETPTMHPLIGGAAARPFVTHHNTLDLRLYMRIAPELYLKRLLVGGFERVYEIGRCYRNEGISTRHNPEFTMLEFYEAYATWEVLMDRTEQLLRHVDASLAAAMPEAQARWSEARPFTFAEPFARVTMLGAVAQACRTAKLEPWIAAIEGGTLDAVIAEDIGPAIKALAASSPRAKAIDWGNFRKGLSKCENAGERLFAAYEYLAEPFLAEDYRSADGTKSKPVFITEYPFETSPLARKNDLRPNLVDRFELFVHGRELCNAFSELNDPADQAERFRAQVEKKAKGADETMDYDDDYVRALEYGMPPAAGFGMGIDRLVMMLTSSPSIRDVLFFPQLRPEVS
jgi:lysyl-tRNA synthetase class 2